MGLASLTSEVWTVRALADLTYQDFVVDPQLTLIGQFLVGIGVEFIGSRNPFGMRLGEPNIQPSPDLFIKRVHSVNRLGWLGINT